MKLKYESQRVRTQGGQPAIIDPTRVRALQQDPSGRRTIEKPDDVEKSAFARPRRPGESYELTSVDNEINTAERACPNVDPVFLDHGFDAQKRLSHCG